MADPAPPAKLGWGGYFASYVKKKPPVVPAAATPGPKADETPEKLSAPDVASPAVKSVVVEKAPSTILARKPTDGFQRANNGAKKLYEISTEPVVQKAFSAQRSVSNASRLANMFGMAKSTSNDPSPETTPELPVVSVVAMDIEAQVVKKPEPKVIDTPVIEMPELKLVGAQDGENLKTRVMEAPDVKGPEPKVMPTADAVSKTNEGIPPVPATTKSKKDEVQDMLDFFASQLDGPGDILALPSDSTTKISKPGTTDTRRAAKQKPGRAKPKAVDMLDFLASQLDSASDVYALPGDKKADTQRTEPLSTLPRTEKESSLQNGLAAATPATKTAVNPEPIVREIPQVLQKAAGTGTLTRRDSIWSRQGSQKSTEMVKVVEERKSTTSSTSSELKRAMNGRKDSVWSRQSSRTSSELSTIISDRKSQSPEDIDEQIKLERQRMDADRERMIQLEKQAEDIISERTQMDIERQNMLEEQQRFEAEARRIAEEEKSMQAFIENVERERQLDFENQEKKRRRKEAEDQARREAEEKERIRVAEEQERERLRIQAEEDARRSAELAAEIEAAREAERAEREIKNEKRRVEEQRRNQDEADRLAREEAQRLTAEMARYKDETKRDDATRQTRRTAGERGEKQRYEDEAAEEETRSRQIQRENRRATEEREEQLRYEQRLAEKEAQAREDKRSEKQTMRAADRFTNRDYEQEREKRSGPVGADRLAEAYQYDLALTSPPMLSPSVYGEEDGEYEDEEYEDEEYAEDEEKEDDDEEDEKEKEKEEEEEEEEEQTKEKKLREAEEKIRKAFAGLEEERAQSSAAQNPAVLPRSNTTRDDNQSTRSYNNKVQPANGQRAYGQDPRGVSRFNTTTRGGRPQPPIRGGLPNGLRAGGLPMGPRPRRP